MNNINKSYKFRIYPTDAQKYAMEKNFGCVRFVYNYFLNERKTQYQLSGKSDNYYTQAKTLTELKKQKDKGWLNEINSQVLQQGLRRLESAYSRFFQRKSGFPKFKKKKDKNTFTVPQHISFDNKKIYFPKFRDGIKVVFHQEVRGKVLTATFSRTPSNKYFVSITTEQEIEQKPKTGKEVGIDLGIKDLVITSEGVKFQNNRYLSKYEKQLKKVQQHLSRKKKDSRQYENQRLKVARLHEKIANCRKDTLHKITSRLIKENNVVYLENLNISGMLKNHHLAKCISDCSWNELVRQLEYKGLWYDCEVFKIDRFYPSSKTCSHCGCVQDKMPLNIRKWTCPDCGKKHDRDINAAINILMEGKRAKNNGSFPDLTKKKKYNINKISSGDDDYTDGEAIRPNSRKGKRQASAKSEAHQIRYAPHS